MSTAHDLDLTDERQQLAISSSQAVRGTAPELGAFHHKVRSGCLEELNRYARKVLHAGVQCFKIFQAAGVNHIKNIRLVLVSG